MPRIRTLKPEALQHRKVGPLSDRHFRLWIGLITQADDSGRLVADPCQLRLLVWGYHTGVSLKAVQTGLDELGRLGLITLYRIGDVQYAEFPSWTDHQKIDRPKPSTLPACPSTSIRRAFVDDSTTDRRAFDGDRKDRKDRKEGSEGRDPSSNDLDPPEITTPQEAKRRVVDMIARATKTP